MREWLAAGMQGDMHWMERSADKRMDPQLVLPGAKSIIMLGVNYRAGVIENRESKIENPPRPPFRRW